MSDEAKRAEPRLALRDVQHRVGYLGHVQPAAAVLGPPEPRQVHEQRRSQVDPSGGGCLYDCAPGIHVVVHAMDEEGPASATGSSAGALQAMHQTERGGDDELGPASALSERHDLVWAIRPAHRHAPHSRYQTPLGNPSRICTATSWSTGAMTEVCPTLTRLLGPDTDSAALNGSPGIGTATQRTPSSCPPSSIV